MAPLMSVHLYRGLTSEFLKGLPSLQVPQPRPPAAAMPMEKATAGQAALQSAQWQWEGRRGMLRLWGAQQQAS